MNKKTLSGMRPFFIYSAIVFVLLSTLLFLPNTSDLFIILGWGFYAPYVFLGVYVLGFVFGWFVQKRSHIDRIAIQLLQSLVVLFVTLFNLSIPALIEMPNYEAIQRAMFQCIIIPAVGSAILFFLAQVIVKKIEDKHHEKEKTTK